MPITWDVQPYALVSELFARYTNGVVIVAFRQAESVAKDAEAWMKQNAVWQDRTRKERIRVFRLAEDRGLQGSRFVNPDFTGAREGLTASVVVDYNAKRSRDAAIRNAMKRDVVTLRRINAERTAAGKAPRSTLYNTQSALAQVKAVQRAMQPPISEIRFSHNPDVPYAIWLEIAKGGRYAIIPKTIDHWQPILMNRIRSNLNLVQFEGQVVMGDVISPREQFEAHVAAENQRFSELGEDRVYEPWTPEKQAARRENRRRYVKERSRSYQKGLRADEERRAAEAARRKGLQTDVQRRLGVHIPEEVQRMNLPGPTTRSNQGKRNGSR